MNIDFNEVMDQLAKAFNVTVDKLYPILYRQAIIDGIFSLMWAVFFTVAITVFIKTLFYISKKQREEHEEHGWRASGDWDWSEGRQIVVIIVGAFTTLMGVILIPISLYDALTAFFNTEYYMIKEILKQVK